MASSHLKLWKEPFQAFARLDGWKFIHKISVIWMSFTRINGPPIQIVKTTKNVQVVVNYYSCGLESSTKTSTADTRAEIFFDASSRTSTSLFTCGKYRETNAESR